MYNGSATYRGDKWQAKRPDKLTVAVVVVTGLLCLAVFCFCGFLLIHTNTILFSRGRERNASLPIACVSCVDLISHTSAGTMGVVDPLIDILGKMVDEDGAEKCCAYNSRQMSVLLELSMRRQPIQIEPLKGHDPSNFTLSRASAHKQLYSQQRDSSPVPIFGDCLITTKLRKDVVRNGPNVEHLRGVKVSDELDGLEIVHPGMYQVYSSVNFNPDSAYKCKDFKYQTFKNYIVRKGRGNVQSHEKCPDDESHTILLSASHTCCDECIRDDQTKYSGGMYKLEKGDVIQMKTTANDLVYFQKQLTFLGLFMFGIGSDGSD